MSSNLYIFLSIFLFKSLDILSDLNKNFKYLVIYAIINNYNQKCQILSIPWFAFIYISRLLFYF